MAEFNKPKVFNVRGTLSVQVSCTVMCIRQRKQTEKELSARDILLPPDNRGAANATRHPLTDSLFRNKSKYKFSSGWEVLMGQSEVVNWLKSTPDRLQTMRYAGEWKLPGGHSDDGETLEQTARRELEEEFLAPMGMKVPKDAVLRPFSVRQTRPIRSRSNIVYNFVALESENPWLEQLDVDELNRHLSAKRRKFAQLVKEPEALKALLETPRHERELVTPEVHKIQWMSLCTAVSNCISASVPGRFVNDYQKEQYRVLGKKARDPMIITGAALVDLEMYDSDEAIVKYCSNVNLKSLVKQEQWLFHGMTHEQVQEARLKAQPTRQSVFRTPEEIEKGRQIHSINCKL